jgi:apolipoprotein N-acyltransferase
MPLELDSCEEPAESSHSGCATAPPEGGRAFCATRGKVAGAILASVFLCLFSSPGYFAPWLVWVALVPVFAFLRSVQSWRQAVWIGGAYGLLWSVAVYWPFLAPIARLAQWSPWVAIVGVPLLLLLFALPYVIAAVCTALFRRSGGIVWTLGTAIAWTFCPLTYVSISVFASQYQSPLWLQCAAYGGTYAVQFLIVLINCLLAWGVLAWRSNARTSTWLSLGAAGLIMVVAAVLGAWRIRNAQVEGANGSHTVTIAWLQPGLPSTGVADKPALSSHLASQMATAATWAVSRPEIDAFVLPEISAGIDYQEDQVLRDALAAIIRATGKPLIAHSSVWTHPPEYRGAPRKMNLSLFFDAEGAMTANYAKRTLIPFVEYLPLETSYRWVRHLAPQAAPFAHGNLAVVFPVTPEVKAVPMLCYESLFSDRVRDQIRLGGNLLIEQANDTSIGTGPGSAIHLAQATMRSAEFGLPMVRSTATGVSIAFDARGRFIPGSRMENGEQGPQLARVVVPAQPSFYGRHGNVFGWILAVLFGGCVAHELSRRRGFKLPAYLFD